MYYIQRYMSEFDQSKAVQEYLERRAKFDFSEIRLAPEYDFPRRVVVTGIAMFGPGGVTVKENWGSLLNGVCGIVPYSEDEINGHKVDIAALTGIHTAGRTPDLDVEALTEGNVPTRKVRRMHLSQKIALVTVYQALRDAGVMSRDMTFAEGIDPVRFGGIIGTGVGGMTDVGRVVQEILNGKNRITPSDLLTVIPERVASVPSMNFGLQGPVFTPIAACASGGIAINKAYEQIMLGNADYMLGGGVEGALGIAALRLFQAGRALSDARDSNEASKPFDQERRGFVMSNGGGVLVLENLAHAIKRGARIYAELVGYGESADAGHETAPTGIGSEVAMRKALYMTEQRSGSIPTDKPVYVNAHGTGTWVGDEMEVEVIKNATKDKIPPKQLKTSSTKSMTGHMAGGAGGYEAVVTVLAVSTGDLPPTINRRKPMPGSEKVNVFDRTIHGSGTEVGINNSFGFGGLNASQVFRRIPENPQDRLPRFRVVYSYPR